METKNNKSKDLPQLSSGREFLLSTLWLLIPIAAIVITVVLGFLSGVANEVDGGIGLAVLFLSIVMIVEPISMALAIWYLLRNDIQRRPKYKGLALLGIVLVILSVLYLSIYRFIPPTILDLTYPRRGYMLMSGQRVVRILRVGVKS